MIQSVSEKTTFLLPGCICQCQLFHTAHADVTLVFGVLPTFLEALDSTVILKAQVELGIHQ